jgi:DNA-binding CsgD family transcriptional regulator/PAS domain-containing protein
MMGVALGESEFIALSDRFGEAAIDPSQWLGALKGLADATGSRHGQLIGLGAAGSAPFNWINDMSEQAIDEFIEIGGGDPRINPRVAASQRGRPMETLSEHHYQAVAHELTSDVYADYAQRHDFPYGCQTTLVDSDRMLIGLALLRSQADGPTDEDQRALFTALAPHVRAAVRTQLALEQQGGHLLAGALEQMSVAAFICDRSGLVQSLTPAAEALVSEGDRLTLRAGRLAAANPGEDADLQAAMARAQVTSRAAAPLTTAMILHGRPGVAAPLVVDVLQLRAGPWSLGRRPAYLVIAGGFGRRQGSIVPLLVTAFGLTPAEAEVAESLSRGVSREAIAQQRGVSEHTVRSQLKTIYQKVGAEREGDLVARLAQFY